jgi:hypothetical protein
MRFRGSELMSLGVLVSARSDILLVFRGSMRFRRSELMSLGVLASTHSDILLYHSLILLELFDDYESFLCSHVIFIHCF